MHDFLIALIAIQLLGLMGYCIYAFQKDRTIQRQGHKNDQFILQIMRDAVNRETDPVVKETKAQILRRFEEALERYPRPTWSKAIRRMEPMNEDS